MFVIADRFESLPQAVERDASTGLPLLSEQHAVRKLVLAYQALPYSVAEHGCGKKASLIIEQLLGNGVPAWAVRRVLVLEPDLSPAALAERDFERRPQALWLENPLPRLADFTDPVLHRLLERNGGRLVADGRILAVAGYRLSLGDRVQFAESRSHIATVVTFWDADGEQAVDRVVDPTLDASRFLRVEELRGYLHASEALIFLAPLGGRLRLDEALLTAAQRAAVAERLPAGAAALEELEEADHQELIRALVGAEPGSIGDPATWTYANNYHGRDDPHTRRQRAETGSGDPLRAAIRDLVRARNEHEPEVPRQRGIVEALVDYAKIPRAVHRDARWSRERLEPLADIALAIVYHNALGELAGRVAEGTDLAACLADRTEASALWGIGARLRRRIDKLALVSTDEAGRIDARALTPLYRRAAVETARQMHAAGLVVALDRVGNVHGLRADDDRLQALRAGRLQPADLTRQALVHASHIDTVGDAGKFDGRLGVCGGIETAHLLDDLQRFYGLPIFERKDGRPSEVALLVTAYNNEEMSFTGQGVSMPGSAAVAGQAAPAAIDAMVDPAGVRFGDLLPPLARALRDAAANGEFELLNRFEGDEDAALRDGLLDPTAFYSPHHYERHIEQGPVLDRRGVPSALVETIMGIHQEDYLFEGEASELAALEFGVRLRELVNEARFGDARITIGVMAPCGQTTCHPSPAAAFRCELAGERNHAGSIAMADRRDPGVGAGYLARTLRQWASEHGCRPIVGDLKLLPGLGRNVIPGEARLTLAVEGERADDGALRNALESLAAETLATSTPTGEPVHVQRLESASFVNTVDAIRVSTDLRCAEPAALDTFVAEARAVAGEVARSFAGRWSSSVEQHLGPSSVESTGQVLLMERSYGGSHNPHENELDGDLTRGTLLQLLVTCEVLRRGHVRGLDLFATVEARLPDAWLAQQRRFVSGALHDTCNIAARARRGLDQPRKCASRASRRKSKILRTSRATSGAATPPIGPRGNR